MSDPQFVVKSFARGIKLTRQHVWTPAQDIATALSTAAIEGQPQMAPFRMAWTFTPQSETFGADPADLAPNQLPQVTLPMIFPPPQGTFNATSKAYTSAPKLVELSIGFDQRANPLGITDEWMIWPVENPARPADYLPGFLADADLSRYDTTLRLIQKVPTIFDDSGDSDTYQEVLTLSLPGESLFGEAALNPFVVEDLGQYLNPYGVYYWLLATPGLAGLTGPDVIQKSALVVTGTPAGGSYRKYDNHLHIVIGVTAGDTFTLGTTGGGPYVFVATVTDGQQEIVNGLIALGAADTLWDFTDGGDFNGSFYPPGTGHIIATHKVIGPTADATTAALSNPADGTFVATAGPNGVNANTLAVDDGPHTYTYALLTGDTLTTGAAGLAAAINGNDGYTATSSGPVVFVQNEAGVAFSFTDVSSNAATPADECFIFFALAWPLLAMPNLTLACTFEYPQEARDYSASANPAASPYVQNIPTKHLGQPQIGAFTIPTIPAAGGNITGDDVQQLFSTLEQPLLNRLKAGYGRAPGSEADTFPVEQLAKDAGYQVINVQMFPNWWDVRAQSIDPTSAGPKPWFPEGVGFPYLSGAAPYTNPVTDQRVLRVPTGFVVHHVLVCLNTFPYGDNRIFPQGAWGSFLTPNSMTHKVGVALYSGMRADDQGIQQIAYMEFTNPTGPSDYTTYLVDELKLDSQHTNMLILNCPLSAISNANGGSSYGGTAVGTGKPFWMGAGNSSTQARTPCADLPFNFGGAANRTPPTGGGENLLLVRWAMEDATGGLGNGSTDVLCGPGGHHVILIGKQSAVGSDTDGKVVSSNPVAGPW
jgi:hypothetical protein